MEQSHDEHQQLGRFGIQQMLGGVTSASGQTGQMGPARPSMPPPGEAGGEGPFGGGRLEAIASAAGLDEETVESLQSDLRAAVGSVLEETEDGEDPREAIKSAIESTFAAYGIDAETLKESLGEAGMRPPPPGGGMGGFGSPPSGNSGYASELSAVDFLSQMVPLVDEDA